VPSALETTAAQLIRSQFDPASSKFQVNNPFNNLDLVVEPLLDVNSATAWYLFADRGRVVVVEVTFLQGQEQPVTRSWIDQGTLAWNYAVLHTYAAKAVDHRGGYKDNGA
jgi:hypothetical protein